MSSGFSWRYGADARGWQVTLLRDQYGPALRSGTASGDIEACGLAARYYYNMARRFCQPVSFPRTVHFYRCPVLMTNYFR